MILRLSSKRILFPAVYYTLASVWLIVLCIPSALFGQQYSPESQIVVKLKEVPVVKKSVCADHQTLCIAPLAALDQTFKIRKTTALKTTDQSGVFIINLDDANIDAAIAAYQATGLFAYVERDYESRPLATIEPSATVPTEPGFSKQWALRNDGNLGYASSTAGADIDMDLAWSIEQGSASVIVAILDTGVEYQHPDLKNRIWTNTKEIANGIDDDQNGLIDDILGWDFAEDDNDPIDLHGHGTHVAGILGADANNQVGFAGIDWNCQIMPLKVVRDNNTSSYSDYAQAVYYATDQGAQVINLSLTSYSYSQTLEDAFQYAHQRGVTIVAAMANNGDNTIHHMAKSQYTIAVGASTPADKRASYSNYNDYIDVIAPGAYIYSLNAADYSDDKKMLNGTSQSTPMVSGIASLLIAQNSNRTPDMIKKIIRATAEDGVGPSDQDSPGYDKYYGHGRVNAYRALTAYTGQSDDKPETQDQCAVQAGAPCDDQDPCTIGDVYDKQCGCAGVYAPAACAPIPACVLSSDETFEAGMGQWIRGGEDVELSFKNGVGGSQSVRLRDNSGAASAIHTTIMNLEGHESIILEFSLYASSMEGGEDFVFELSTDGGASYQALRHWSSQSDFDNDVRQSIALSFNDLSLSSQTVFRLRCDASSNMDMIYLDNIKLESCAHNTADCQAGTPCDDRDECTVNDALDENCDCLGIYVDNDGDGYCQAEDADDSNSCIPDGSECDAKQDQDSCITYDEADFESGSGIWTLGGSDTRLYRGNASSGSMSLRLRDDSGVLSSAFTEKLDLSTHESLEVSFTYYAVSMENGEDFLFEISSDGGRSFSTVKSWVSGVDFKNLERQNSIINLNRDQLSSQTVIRFRCDASANSDLIYIDDIVLLACGGSEALIYESTASTRHQDLSQAGDSPDLFEMEASVYPNPASEYIVIDLKNVIPMTTMTAIVYDASGRQLLESQFSVDYQVMIDITTLEGGRQYMLSVAPSGGGESQVIAFFKL